MAQAQADTYAQATSGSERARSHQRAPGSALGAPEERDSSSTVLARVVRRLKHLGSDEGLAITEYGMLVAFAAIVLIAAITIFSSQISSWFAARTGQITSS